MSVPLLDVNILLALLQDFHEFHDVTGRWFNSNRSGGWATCSITEAGFVRISARTFLASRTVPRAMEAITSVCSAPEHQFWPLDFALSEIPVEIRERIHGPSQLTDTILLTLAIRRGGRLVTLDQGIRKLLPESST